ncbi:MULTISPECIES: restriction endonuclease subunit S [unclassified Apibacter]|uniref:restriction endonuclease subunit S n=1 Tax=unclassified Apibacter TaxID=2630820 RepID=UPI001371A4AF|nr:MULTISPECIES: restriction endonuclease subunit S [unclassified Apibacter]
MSKKKELIPKLRFPEFVDEGEWEEKKLGKIAKYENGKAHEQNIVKQGNYIAVNSKFISTDGKVKKYTNTANCLASKGEILMVLSDLPNGKALAKCFYVDINNNYSVNQRICKITPINAENKILYYLLNRNSYFLSFDDGVKQTNLRNEDVLKCPIILPKIQKEQQKIASCLSSLDEMIAAQGQKLDLLKDHKKGLMQKLFPQEGEKVPKYRFKEFEKDGEWVEKKIIETTDKKIKWSFTGGPFGSNLKASDYTTEGIRIIQLQNIGDGEFNNEYKIYTSKEKADKLLSCNIYSDEIILSKMGDPVGRACIIPSYLNRCVMASDGIRLVVDEKKYSKYFIYSIINSKQIREAIEKKSTGSTRKRIGLDELKGIELMIPKTIKEQQKIASCLSSLDALITAQTEKIEQLKLHKKGLMQGLFPKIND